MTTPTNQPDQYVFHVVDEYVDKRARLARGGYGQYSPELFEARAELLGQLANRTFDPEDWDETTSTWVTWIGNVEESTPPDQLRAKLAHELSFYAKTMPQRYERQERNQGIKAEIEAHMAGFDKDRDGLPSGRYEEVGGEFKRIGDTEVLETYHGTVQPKGEIIQEFTPSYGNPDSDNRPSVGNTPAIYSTPDAEAALEYAMGYNNAFVGKEAEGQLYKLNLKPDEIVDLGHCQDDASARLAIKKGFDVIECPDFWEQSETITFDPKKIEVDAVYPVTDSKDADEPDLDALGVNPEGDRQIDELKAQGFIGDPVYQREDGRMGRVQEAVGEYKDANPSVSERAPKGIMDKFPHMFPKANMNAGKSGRGSMRY